LSLGELNRVGLMEEAVAELAANEGSSPKR
jgi:hypothetical protein